MANGPQSETLFCFCTEHDKLSVHHPQHCPSGPEILASCFANSALFVVDGRLLYRLMTPSMKEDTIQWFSADLNIKI